MQRISSCLFCDCLCCPFVYRTIFSTFICRRHRNPVNWNDCCIPSLELHFLFPISTCKHCPLYDSGLGIRKIGYFSRRVWNGCQKYCRILFCSGIRLHRCLSGKPNRLDIGRCVFNSGVFSCGEAFKEGTLYWVINIPFFISEVYKEKFAPRGRSRLDNCAKVSACKLRMPDTCVVVPTRYKSFLCKLLELKNRYYPIQFSQHFYFIILFLN